VITGMICVVSAAPWVSQCQGPPAVAMVTGQLCTPLIVIYGAWLSTVHKV